MSKPMQRPPVEDARPPRQGLRVINPLLRTLLTSPLHRPFSKWLMLLHVVGRRTGRMHQVVVGRHQDDATLLVSASGNWRHNLRGGAPVFVTLDQRQHRGYAVLEEDPDEVARIYVDLLARVGLRRAAMVGLRVNVDRLPTPDEIKHAVAARGIVRIKLDGKEHQPGHSTERSAPSR